MQAKAEPRHEAMIQIDEQKLPKASHVFILKSFNIYTVYSLISIV